MGTRRSRHNKGRKPRYKDYERTTLDDILPVRDIKLDHGIERPEKWAKATKRIKTYIPIIKAAPTIYNLPSPDPKLATMVSAYLDKRAREVARKEVDQTFPVLQKTAEHFALPLRDEQSATTVGFSERDILLQLYMTRRITGSQFHAGRKWQFDRECGAIQPNQSINLDMPRLGYQRRGDLSDGQINAMERRNRMILQSGDKAVHFLDFCLEADRSIDAIIIALGISEPHFIRLISTALIALCSCYGISSVGNHYTRKETINVAGRIYADSALSCLAT